MKVVPFVRDQKTMPNLEEILTTCKFMMSRDVLWCGAVVKLNGIQHENTIST
jgi:hypothetical protein